MTNLSHLEVDQKTLSKAVERARQNNIILPTFEELKHPEKIPEYVKKQLRDTGLWDLDPVNLFRITWKNEPTFHGGLYNGVNYIELPSELTGVEARIVALVGKWFPTGSHKVGATYGCLIPRLVTGTFDPTYHKAVWPSTGNFCRGGAFNAAILSCASIGILPEGMSAERFEWLEKIAGEIISTPGSESNVKEIFDKTWELRYNRDDVQVLNQFEDFGNHLWHYEVTGHAMEEVLNEVMAPEDRFVGTFFTSGSSGTLGCSDYLKKKFPGSKLGVGEALQCPTLTENGFGAHRIEGIGDKHVPWIHNVKNTDLIVAIDDNHCMELMRVFNNPAGKQYLNEAQQVPEWMINQLPLMGISGIANVLGAIKMAKYYELTSRDVIMTCFTDSMELYQSRLAEMNAPFDHYGEKEAAVDYTKNIGAGGTANVHELDYTEKKSVHNLKYYTWVEQQGKHTEDLNAQWYDYHNYWGNIHQKAEEIDHLIEAFNRETGLCR